MGATATATVQIKSAFANIVATPVKVWNVADRTLDHCVLGLTCIVASCRHAAVMVADDTI